MSDVRRYVVSGVVQGVGYRAFAQRVARDLRLSGWVRNLRDGSVEVLVQGSLTHIERFAAELRIGPPRARVTEVRLEELAAEASEPQAHAAGAKGAAGLKGTAGVPAGGKGAPPGLKGAPAGLKGAAAGAKGAAAGAKIEGFHIR